MQLIDCYGIGHWKLGIGHLSVHPASPREIFGPASFREALSIKY
ncbi:MAG: hypothetical protein V7K69_10695 [Nostoc sp.]